MIWGVRRILRERARRGRCRGVIFEGREGNRNMGKGWAVRIVGGVIAVAAALGFKVYQKSQDSAEVKAELIALCQADAPCVAAVNEHFEQCFDDAYSMGGRNQGPTLNTQTLATCINTASGAPHFTAQ
jgi:hypothetical protein